MIKFINTWFERRRALEAARKAQLEHDIKLAGQREWARMRINNALEEHSRLHGTRWHVDEFGFCSTCGERELGIRRLRTEVSFSGEEFTRQTCVEARTCLRCHRVTDNLSSISINRHVEEWSPTSEEPPLSPLR